MKLNSAATFINRLKVIATVPVLLAVGVLQSPQVFAQTTCSTTTSPATTYGQVKQSMTVPTSGTYRVWSRIKAPDTTNNSYYLQIDGGCAYKVGDAGSIPANTWTWVNYQNGSTSNFIDVSLTAATHNLTYTGSEPNVELDRVMFLADTTCTPTGTGDNCADSIAPTVSITSPSNGSSVTAGTTVNITASASDNVGVAKVEFYVDGTLKSSDTASPYSYSWSTSGVSAGSHSLTARAYDASNNSATSNAVSVSVGSSTNPPPPPSGSDTTPPTVTLTATPDTIGVGQSTTLSANATDDTGVTKVSFYAKDGTLLSTDTSAPYTYVWTPNNTGTKGATAKAYDAAGNVGTSNAVTITVGTTPTPPPPPVNPPPPPVNPPPPTPTGTPGDANGDGRVNGLDYSILSEHDGQNYPAADFNGDGTVGAADLAILLAHWTW